MPRTTKTAAAILRPTFRFENACRRDAEGPVCGIDEVGRGPLAGPVVAAAVILDRARFPKQLLAEINDSKKLTPLRRAALYKHIHDYADVAIASCDVEEIDRLNILHASLLAMTKACEKLSTKPVFALVDGNKAPRLDCRIQTIVQGDARSLSIAAASIVAKHYRDTWMAEQAKIYPVYAWEQNVGYATRQHLEAIEIHGISPLHRRSFAPTSKQSVKESSANN